MAQGSGVEISRTARVEGLDFLRAAAIFAVLVFHLAAREAWIRHWPTPPWAATLGYLGVELFFVLSGFLIGRILIGIAGQNPTQRDWLIFLVRRWMRTLPLYFLWLAILLLALPPAADALREALLYSTFTQNLAWPLPSDEWFSVSWSLTVEEWFYLLFAVVVAGLVAARIRKAILVGCLVFLTLPLAARIFLISPTAPFDAGMREIALARLDAIAYGVAGAWFYAQFPELFVRWRRALFIAGCVVLLGPMDLLAALGSPSELATVRPFLFSFTSIGFALCIPAALHLRIPAAWFAAAVRWLSERSYCLYIVHLTIIEEVWRYTPVLGLPVLLRTPIVLAISAVLCELSFRFLETPLLRLRPRQSPVARTVPDAEARPDRAPAVA